MKRYIKAFIDLMQRISFILMLLIPITYIIHDAMITLSASFALIAMFTLSVLGKIILNDDEK